MSPIKSLVVGVVLLLAATGVQAGELTQLEKNKAIVVDFYNKALNDKDIDAAIALMGPTYTQHNARIPDGKEGFRQFFTGFKQKFPNSHSTIVRVFAEGDYVILHVHMVREPATRGEAVMDIFRLENGKLVEHWDVLQAIPETIPHSNTMF
ncbi:nuclear transport factor 2 family protein [Hyphomicrobium sp. 802]|uniref:nuclear transport factor 2 family protein n=1 Tax=Hyphomicrobium sp. 802 TaxID=1112272 RepID=UPI00045EB03D|nr:nuclear transport factor 2 family protein [Hyphomicrobium sp. 802]